MSSTSIDHSSSPKIRNLVFLGSTGAGKSSTCNTIYQTKSEPFGPFVTGNDETSCTEDMVKHVCKYKDLNLIDAPGFDNNRYTEEKVDEFLRDVSSVFSEPDERNSKQIDAFILVTKLTPRAQTLRSDVERVRELFGATAFKSLILLIIYDDGNGDGSNFLDSLGKMTEVVRIMKEGKPGRLSADWFCVWDNENPRENQETELLEKITRLKPYTHSEFAEFNTIMKQAVDLRTKGDFEKDQFGSTTDAISTMEELDEKAPSTRKREDSMDKILRLIEIKHQSYTQQLNEALIQNNEMIEKVMNRVEQLEKGAKNIEQHRYFGSLFMDLVCCRRKLKPEERKELAQVTLKKGAKKAAKEGVGKLAMKGGQEIAHGAKETVKKGAKEGLKKAAKEGAKILIKKALCNQF